MTKEDDILTAVNTKTLKCFLATIGKSGRFNAVERITELTGKQLNDVCSALEVQVVESVQAVAQAQEGEQGDAEDVVMELGEVLLALQGAAHTAHALLQNCHSHPPPALLNAAVSLHDNCLLAVGDLPDLQDPVSRLCCTWWELQAPGKEQLMAQTLPYILIRAESTERAVDVKVCCTMREAFALLDFSDPSIADLKRLLLQAAFSPAFLHRPEGRRFLASLFNLDKDFVADLTAIIKNQIPSGRKTVLDAYGEVIFRAWKEATGPCLLELENTCIQGLMQAAVQASTPPLAAALRQVLNGLHSEKRVAGVDALLHRLYGPVLFRAFDANNAALRLNALNLMLDAFPITDPDASTEDTEEALARQFNILKDCLVDVCPLVRMAAVRSVSRVLNLFWELIPATTIAWLVTKLTGELAYDMSWPGVRVGVLEGLRQLVDNPHAQPVMKKALPQLASLLADPSLKVREAMASLLCALSSSRAIHFYDVVPLDMLLDAMAHDQPSVSHKIQSILVPSYFPSPEEGSARVAMLLKANPSAGAAFCQYLVSSFTDASFAQGFRASVPIEHVAQLALDLKSHLLASYSSIAAAMARPAAKKSKAGRGSKKQGKAVTGKRRKQAAGQGEDQEGGDDEVEATEAVEVVVDEDPETIEGWTAILNGLTQVCSGLSGAVRSLRCGEGDVAEVFQEDELALLYEACPSDEARSLVLRIVSALPFLPAAAAVRSRLLTDIASGRLLADASDVPPKVGGSAAGPSSAPSAPQTEGSATPAMLPEAIRSLYSHPTGAKLLAMMMASLSLRPSGTVHLPAANKPAGAKKPPGAKKQAAKKQAEADEDDLEDVRCLACGEGEPEESILMCDGCDDAYHMSCLRPAIETLPEGAWFCHRCEQEIQHCTMGSKQALSCLSASLSIPEGRTALRSQGHLTLSLLEGTRGLAHQQGQLLLRAISAMKPAAAPEGAAADAVGLYCRTALHLALTNVFETDVEESGDPSAGLQRTQEALTAAVAALNEALEMSGEVLELCFDEADHVDGNDVDGGAGAAAEPLSASNPRPLPSSRLSPEMLEGSLGFVAAVLAVVADAQQLSILDFGAGGGQQVPRLCDIGSRALKAALASIDTSAAGTSAVPSAAAHNVVSHVLSITKHLMAQMAAAAAAKQASSAAAQGGRGEGRNGLEHRLDAEMDDPSGSGAAADAAAVAAMAHLDGLVTQLIRDLLSPASRGLLVSIKPQLSSLLGSLLDQQLSPTARQTGGGSRWLAALAAGVGHAVVSSAPEGADVLPSTTTGGAAREAAAVDEEATEGRRGRRGSSRRSSAVRPQQKAVEVDGEADDDVDDGGDDVRGPPDVGEGGEGTAEGPSTSLLPAALSLSDPSASLMCGMLMTLVRSRKLHGTDAALDRLAGLASEAWVDSGAEAGLGAVYMMGLLGFKGMQGRRLRLTGSEANTLLKLELLHKDIKVRQEAQDLKSTGGGDAAAVGRLGVYLDQLLA